MLFSYDIFDTILFRSVPKSTDIFRFMETHPVVKSIWNKRSKRFSICRQRSEFWIRRKKGPLISIEDIYHELQRCSHISNEEMLQLMQIEYEIEQENSFLNPTILNEIKQRLQSKEEVIILSDMYWHENQLKDLLSSKDPLFEIIEIYVSCYCKAAKSSGKLHSYVRNQRNITGEWVHIGDNKVSDGEVPRRLHITPVITSRPLKYDFEREVGDQGYSALLTYGVIARSRVNSTGRAFDLGASIAGPLVYQYVDWVLQEATRKNIQKLYFVLRDGYILKKVADVIVGKRNLSIQTEYIFGSRVAWRLPEVTLDKLHNMSVWDQSNWIFRDPCMTYVAFERVGFSRESTVAMFGEDFAYRVLQTYAEFKAALETALNNDLFCEKLLFNISEAGDNLEHYFADTMNENEDYAFVDTNSTGLTQHDLNLLLERHSQKRREIRFFYHTFLGEAQINDSNQFVFIKATEDDKRIPEAFFRAPYNPCYGYKKTSDGKVEPVFFESDIYAWTGSFEYEEYLSGILSFTETMERQTNKIDINSYADYLFKIVNFDKRSKDYAREVAGIPFYPDLKGEEVLDFYPALKLSALFHPFSKLIYYPKGSYYNAGGIWIIIYKILYGLVQLRKKVVK